MMETAVECMSGVCIKMASNVVKKMGNYQEQLISRKKKLITN